MHSLAACSATVCCYHCSVCFLVEFNSKVIEPLDNRRSLIYKSVNELRLSVKVSASESVKIVLCRAVIRFVCSLNSAFCHHCVCITDAEFCCKKNFCSSFACHDCSRCTGSATTDYKNICFVVNVCKINVFRLESWFCLKHCCKFNRSLLSFVRSDFELFELACNAVRVIFFKERVLFICSKTSVLEFKVFFAFCSNNFGCFVKIISVHVYYLCKLRFVQTTCACAKTTFVQNSRTGRLLLFFYVSCVVEFLYLVKRLVHDVLDHCFKLS